MSTRRVLFRVEKDEEAPRGMSTDWALVGRLSSYVLRERRLLGLGLALLVLASLCRLALPWLVMVAIDDYLTPGNLSGFGWICAAFCGVAALDFFLRRTQLYALDKAGQNAILNLRLEVFRHLQRLSSSFYDRTAVGRLVGRVTTDVEALQELFSSGVVTIVGDLFFLSATLAILFWLNTPLTLLVLLVIPVLLVASIWIRTRVRGHYVRMRAQLSRLNAFLQEQISGLPVVQAFTAEEQSRGDFQKINEGVREAQLKSVFWESNLSAVTEMLGSFTLALILGYGGGLVASGEVGTGVGAGLTLGALFAFLDYMQKFFQPLNDLSQKYTVFQNALTASERIFQLLDRTEILPEVEEPVELPESRGEIEFRDVVFGYGDGENVLHGLSFRVAPGEKVAVVGPTGAGKSTILGLLTRLYDVRSGSVLVDGLDVREWPKKELRRRIGLVTQDVFLFEGNVLENVRLGSPDIDDAQAMAVADGLHLDAVVARFPGGYFEPVTERGKNLSAGEGQLIAFARVLARGPAILALDEATSNVDSATEELLQEALWRVAEGRSALIVAHRLATVRDADRILVLELGRVVEQGSHAELLASQGHYWSLHQLQFQSGE